MTDVFSESKRSYVMSRVGSQNTTPEKIVRSHLHRRGFRFRLHGKKLPGKPDIVLPKYGAVVFVHGCFWHRHYGCRYATTPATRTKYWNDKFRRNQERDRKQQQGLIELGWRVMIVWECEIRNFDKRKKRLKNLCNQLSSEASK